MALNYAGVTKVKFIFLHHAYAEGMINGLSQLDWIFRAVCSMRKRAKIYIVEQADSST